MDAIILTAGEGKRIRSEIGKSNKCLLEIEGSSLLVNTIELLLSSLPIERITIVVGCNAKSVKEIIGNDFNGIPVSYVEQEKTDGILGALDLAVQNVDNDAIIQLGDEYYHNPQYNNALRRFENNDCVFGVCEGTEEQVCQTYSIKYSDDGEPVEFCEKPQTPFNNHVGTGMVLIKKSLFPSIHKLYREDNKRELVDLFSEIVKNKGKIESCIVTDFYENINEIENYRHLIDYLDEQADKHFFGVFNDIYKTHHREVKVVSFYHSKFSEVYESMSTLIKEEEKVTNSRYDNDFFWEVEFYRSYLALSGSNKVLELACGSGRITVAFAAHKVSITGIDTSKDMLDILLEKVEKENRKYRKYITIIQDDITTLEKVRGKFNLVIFPATTIRLLDMDLVIFIDNIYDYVEENGYFIFDIVEPKRGEYQMVVDNMYNLSYRKNDVENIMFFQEEHDFVKRKTRVNFYLTTLEKEIKHYLSYTYLNIIDRKIIEKAVSKTRFKSVSFEKYNEDEKNMMFFCVLGK